jgi:hypothetical protein
VVEPSKKPEKGFKPGFVPVMGNHNQSDARCMIMEITTCQIY